MHAGRVGTTSRHEHCPRVYLAGAPQREPTVGPELERARISSHSRAEPPAVSRPVGEVIGWRHRVLATRLAGRSRRRPGTRHAASHVCCQAVARLERADSALLHGAGRARIQSQRRTARRGQFEVAALPTIRMLCLSLRQVEGRKRGRP